MTCANHPDAEVSAYCRNCGKALCTECRNDVAGTVYCSDHVPAAAPEPIPAPGASQGAGIPLAPPPFAGSPYNATPPPPGGTPYIHSSVPGTPSPALAFLLGFIPGVGAIYNGQYAKGLVHAVVFGLIITILNSNHSGFEPLFAIFLAIWVFYMAFEAHHTATKRRSGMPVDELSSLMSIPSNPGGVPIGPVILIGLGVLLLLDTLDLMSFDRITKYWPLLLIIGGAYMLYMRVEGRVRNDGGAK
jgi:hypothetical protein